MRSDDTDHMITNQLPSAENPSKQGTSTPPEAQKDVERAEITFTTITKTSGPLTKVISKDGDGLKIESSQCKMWDGTATVSTVKGLKEFAAHLEALTSSQAITLGRPKLSLARDKTEFDIKPTGKLAAKGYDKSAISRSKKVFAFEPIRMPMLIDFDKKAMPKHVAEKLDDYETLWSALTHVAPGLDGAGYAVRRSTSAGIVDTETGKEHTSSGGQHLYFIAADGTDIPRATKDLHHRMILDGSGWIMIGKAGQLLVRSPVDATVGSPERLAFEGSPSVHLPLDQPQEARRFKIVEGPHCNTATAIPALSPDETTKLNAMIRQMKADSEDEAAEIHEAWLDERSEAVSKKTGRPKAEVRAAYAKSAKSRELLPDFMLHFDRDDLGEVTVADILADPDKFEGETLADPLDGTDYGPCKAMVMGKSNTSDAIIIHSTAHGLSQTYFCVPPLSRGAKRTLKKIRRKIASITAQIDADGVTNAVQDEVRGRVVETIIGNTMQSQKDSYIWFLNREGSLVRFPENKVWGALCETFGSPISQSNVEDLIFPHFNMGDKKEASIALGIVKGITGAVRSSIMGEIDLYRQRALLSWEVDMFVSTHSMRLRKDDAVFILPHVPWQSGSINMAVVNDFRQHMPLIDDLLKFIVDARFASDRKKAFIWWLATSDFGKGFVTSALQQIGALAAVSVSQIEMVMRGNPVGVAPEEFRRAIVLHIDEWSKVTAELKLLQSSMDVSPKHQMRQRVPLYTKLFTSADEVPSLATTQGVEDQFANRMSLITNEGTIETRPLFQKLGKAAYATSVRNWFAETLNEHTTAYQALGRAEAARVADAEVNAFHAKHGIGAQRGTVGERLRQIAADFCEAMLEPREQLAEWQSELDLINATEHDAKADRDKKVSELLEVGKKDEAELVEKRPVLSSDLYKKRDHLLRKIMDFKDDRTEPGVGEMVILTKPKKHLMDWIKAEFTASEFKTISERAADILKHVPIDGKPAQSHRSTRLNKVVKGVKIR